MSDFNFKEELSKLTSDLPKAPALPQDPIFEHDCDHCIYLGHYVSDWASRELFEACVRKDYATIDLLQNEWRPEVFDLYVHTGANPTVVARYGNAGQYRSGIEFAGSDEVLTEAVRRALALIK